MCVCIVVVVVVVVHSTSCDNPVRTNYLGHLQNPSLDHETNFVKHMLRILIIRPLFLIFDFGFWIFDFWIDCFVEFSLLVRELTFKFCSG